MSQVNDTTQIQQVTDWQEFTGFTDVFPAVECHRHSWNNYLLDVQTRKSHADNLPIPLAVLFASQERLNAVSSL